MLRKRVIGDHKKQIDSIVNMTLPSHAQGQGRDIIENMASAPTYRRCVRFVTSQILRF